MNDIIINGHGACRIWAWGSPKDADRCTGAEVRLSTLLFEMTFVFP